MGWKEKWIMRSRKFPAIQIGFVALLFGVTLILQPSRWANTPSYANLLELLSAQWWGVLYLFTAVLLFAAVRFRASRTMMVIAHTVAIALFAAWLLAFVVRYATDGGTTIVNIVSWSVFVSRLIQSSIILDDEVTLMEINREERA